MAQTFSRQLTAIFKFNTLRGLIMAEAAFQQQFRQEFIGAFEMTKTQLRETVVKEADVRGNQATFPVQVQAVQKLKHVA